MTPPPPARRDTDADDSAPTEIVTPPGRRAAPGERERTPRDDATGDAARAADDRDAPGRGPLLEIGGYRIDAEVGRGGMGIVYRATDTRLGRAVAIKTIQQQGGADSEAAQRFIREARGLARLGKHPHIVQIHEVGEVSDRFFFVMDYVGGPALSDVLDQGPFPLERAATLAEKLARALDHAHRHGLIHRDVKPSNVLLTPDGEPQLTDFGLAKDVHSQDDLSKSGDILGTPSYMAPEQAEAEGRVDARADVYGMGALLYHMVTGQPPFRGQTWMETVALVLGGHLTPPSALRPGVGRDLQAIIEKALERDPARRYGSAAELAEDLGRLLNREPVLARPRSSLRRLGAWARRRPVRAGLAAFLLATALAAAAIAPPILAERRRAVEAARLERAAEEAEAARVATLEAAKAKRSEARERAGRVDEVVRLLDEAIALDPTSWEAHWERALARLGAADEQARQNERFNSRYDTTAPRRIALTDLDRALALAPAATAVLLDRAEARAALGDEAGAEADHARFVRDDPDPAAAYYARARVRAKQGDAAGAARLLDRAIALDPGKAGYYLLRGAMRPRVSDPRGAVADLAKAIELEPDNPEAHYAYGSTVQFYLGDFETALRSVERAIELAPREGNYWFARGNLRRLIDPADTGPIVADYRKAMELAPKLSGPAANLGVVLFHAGDHAGARAAFDEAIEVDPSFGMSYYMRALTWLSEEPPDRARARADLDRACERAGGQPEPFLERAALCEEDRDLAGALADLRAASDRLRPGTAQRKDVDARIAALEARRAAEVR